ncbi:MAG: beta strand repeat-containing protein [bacterium]
MATTALNSETNALYLGLFDRPADPSGQTYWATLHGNSSTALSSSAVDSMSAFATYNGAALSSSNIASEIVNIYADLLGTTVTILDPGVQYWASQSTYDGGTMSIGEIVTSIYNVVNAYPSTNIQYTVMNGNINAAQASTTSMALSGLNPALNSETNALYLGLFDRPADPSGQTYWATLHGNSSTALSSFALNSMSTFATYNGAALSSSNIASEIVNIYADLLGTTVTTSDPGVQYWASQSTYDGGTMSIGQIVASMYNVVNAYPTTSTQQTTMNANISHTLAATTSTISSEMTPLVPGATTQLITPGITTSLQTNDNYNVYLPSSTADTTLSITGSGNNIVGLYTNNANNTITITGNGDNSVYTNPNNTIGTGNNTITMSGSGTDTVSVGQGNNTIDLGGTSGTATISIGQGNNTITFGTGTDSLNLTSLYSTTVSGGVGIGVAGTDTLNGVMTGDTLVFNQSTGTAASALLTTTLSTAALVSAVGAEITTLQTSSDIKAGTTSVVWIAPAAGENIIVMDHNTGSGFVDQVIQITGTTPAPATYLSGAAVSVNHAGFVSVAL